MIPSTALALFAAEAGQGAHPLVHLNAALNTLATTKRFFVITVSVELFERHTIRSTARQREERAEVQLKSRNYPRLLDPICNCGACRALNADKSFQFTSTNARFSMSEQSAQSSTPFAGSFRRSPQESSDT